MKPRRGKKDWRERGKADNELLTQHEQASIARAQHSTQHFKVQLLKLQQLSQTYLPLTALRNLLE